MPTALLVTLLTALAVPADPPAAPEPSAVLVTRLEHAGRALEGPRRIKLALTRGERTLWTHDGTVGQWGEPEGSFEVEWLGGELRLELGSEPMNALPAELLAEPAGGALHLWVEVTSAAQASIRSARRLDTGTRA